MDFAPPFCCYPARESLPSLLTFDYTAQAGLAASCVIRELCSGSVHRSAATGVIRVYRSAKRLIYSPVKNALIDDSRICDIS
jgi:hypothetical protein